MRKLVLSMIGVVALAHTALATTTAELKLVIGASTLTILDNGTGDNDASTGTINYINHNFNGWDIKAVIGDSNSPNLQPYGIDLSSLTASCRGGACVGTTLQVWFSDLNFTQPSGQFANNYSATDTGSAAKTSQQAWVNLNNSIFGTQNSLGTVGPFTGAGVFAGSTHANVTTTASPYSLTLEQIFTHTGSGSPSVAFSVDGNIGSIPEPGAIVLFGTVLVLGMSKLRRSWIS